MKIVILKILVFIFLVVGADQLTGVFLEKLYFSQKNGQGKELNYVFSECKADILIFGNSRAQHHYDSEIITRISKKSCYNAGQDGGHSILLPLAQLKIIINRYSPKIIILELDPSSFAYSQENYEKLSILLPYYNQYSIIRPIIELRSPYEKIKTLSGIYPYNSNIINIVRYNTNTSASRNKSFNGYIPINKNMTKTDLLKNNMISNTQSICDTNLLNALNEFILCCKYHNIELFIINSPVFGCNVDVGSTMVVGQVIKVIKKKNVKYLDFSKDSFFCNRPELFADRMHLNDKGARIFSRLIIYKLELDQYY